jgi:hypothetical protein
MKTLVKLTSFHKIWEEEWFEFDYWLLHTNEKQNQGINDYEPAVTVSTKTEHSQKFSDNANGIPMQSLDKIFQPLSLQNQPVKEGTGFRIELAYV